MKHAEQHQVGWVCPKCKLTRGEDQCDPCIGKLPGVLFACCGHGDRRRGGGYIYFENGRIIRFGALNMPTEMSPEEDITGAKAFKERLGQ